MIIASKSNSNKTELKRPVLPLLVLFSVITVGTIGYYIMWQDKEDALFDAFYMVGLTITTVGFHEVHELDKYGQIFTMFVAITGIGSLFFIFSVFMENLFIIQNFTNRSRKKMLKEINEMENHFIIIGFGRVGALAAYELVMRKEDFVVIDKEFEENDILSPSEYKAIEGDAMDDDTLELANIKNAKALIVATSNPEITVFVVLSAKQLNPNLHIVARSDFEQVTDKLIKAGADKVVNPYAAGGYKMASLAANPTVVDFFDSNLRGSSSGFELEMIELPDSSKLIGKSLSEINIRKKTGASVIGVIREDDRVINPGGEYVLESKDKIMVIGNLSQIQKFEKMILN